MQRGPKVLHGIERGLSLGLGLGLGPSSQFLKDNANLLIYDGATTWSLAHVILILFHSENHKIKGMQCRVSGFPLEVLSATTLLSYF